MLDFCPDRLSHVVCLEPAERDRLLRLGIPLELCLTSNVLTESVPSYDRHHFGAFFERRCQWTRPHLDSQSPGPDCKGTAFSDAGTRSRCARMTAACSRRRFPTSTLWRQDPLGSQGRPSSIWQRRHSGQDSAMMRRGRDASRTWSVPGVRSRR